jgi:hypothetical protein
LKQKNEKGMCRRVRGQEAFGNGMMRKTKKPRGRRLLTVLLFVLLTTAASLVGIITAVQGAEVERGVTRYTPAGPAPGAEFEVKLTITGELPLIVGIVETIPEGFSFVSTTCEDYEVSGQKIAFAVLDETEITYWVKAPSSGEGLFTGTWIDMLSDSEGSITDTTTPPVTTPKPTPKPSPTATAAATATTTTTATPAAIPASEIPGFGVIFTAVSLLIASLFVVMRRTKGEGGKVK